MAKNSYMSWEAFPLADSPEDPDPDTPFLKLAQKLEPTGPVAAETDLAANRAKIAQEFQDNADLRRKLMASTTAEVGNQGEDAKLAYIESTFNRAASRGKSLDQTISDTGYYPKATTSQLGATPSKEEQDRLNPLINQALGGSNIARFATGNESGGVHSGGAPVAYDPQSGERFVVENADKKWAANTQARLTPAPTPSRKLTIPELISAYGQIVQTTGNRRPV